MVRRKFGGTSKGPRLQTGLIRRAILVTLTALATIAVGVPTKATGIGTRLGAAKGNRAAQVRSSAAFADFSHQDITSTGPLATIGAGNDLSCQVAYQGDSSFEFFGPAEDPADCGTFLSVGGQLYAPDFANHDTTATEDLGAYAPFTPVSQTGVTGSGTPSDPYRVVTDVMAGSTGLSLSQTDTYVAGESRFQTDVSITNTTGSSQEVILYRAGDCYLADSDDSQGFYDTSSGAIACSDPATNRLEQWTPITPGSSYIETLFGSLWSAIGNQTSLPDTCDCSTNEDSAAGLSWNVAVPAGQSITVSDETNFGLEQAWEELGPQAVVDRRGAVPYAYSGRVDSLALDPVSPSVVYAGSPGGGVWKGVLGSGGASWAPYLENVPVGSLASVGDGSGGTILYAGTGEDGGGNVVPGRGIVRSGEGQPWSTVAGVLATGDAVAQIAVRATSPKKVFAATAKGLLYSANGGASWQKVQRGHFTAVVQDPSAPSRWWAAKASGSPSTCTAKVYALSTAGGTVQTVATHAESFIAGGPSDPFVALAVAANGLVYASFSSCWANFKKLMRVTPSTGNSFAWKKIADPSTPNLKNYYGSIGNTGQGDFDNVLAVDPFDPAGCRLVLGGVDLYASLNACATRTSPTFHRISTNPVDSGAEVMHEDQHAVVFTGRRRFLVANDGGVWKTTCMGGIDQASIPCSGSPWVDLNTNLAVTQFYEGDARSTDAVLGGAQDGGTVELASGGWTQDAGGDGGYSFYTPDGASWEYAQQDIGIAVNGQQGLTGQCDPNSSFNRSPATCNNDHQSPFQFPNPPMFVDAHDDRHLFFATNRVWEAKNGPQPGGWDAIGPLLAQPAGVGFCGSDLDPIAQGINYCPDYVTAMSVTDDTNQIFTASAYGEVWRGSHGVFGWSWDEIDGGLPIPTPTTKPQGIPWVTGIGFNPQDPKELWVTIYSRNGGQVWHTTDDTQGSSTAWSDVSGSAFGKEHQPTAIAVTSDDQTSEIDVYVGTSDGGVLKCAGCSGAAPSTSWSNISSLPSVWVNSFSCTRDGSALVAWTRGRGAWAATLTSVVTGCAAAEQSSIPGG
jgi:hypothetical protein